MIEIKTCAIIVCDGCKNRLDRDYEPHFGDATEARWSAHDDDEWWSDGTQDLCGSCSQKPHEPVPDNGDPLDCARCGYPVREHDSEILAVEHA